MFLFAMTRMDMGLRAKQGRIASGPPWQLMGKREDAGKWTNMIRPMSMSIVDGLASKSIQFFYKND